MKKIICLSIVLLLGVQKKMAQGCSDAGFCSVSYLKPSQQEKILKNSLKTGVFWGKAEKSIHAYGGYLEYNGQYSQSFGIGIKVTSLGQRNASVSQWGLGDIFLDGNYRFDEKLSATLGVKIPLTNGATTYQNKVLPPEFQSSLGTFDLIFATSYQVNNLQFTFGVQQPLWQGKAQTYYQAYHGDYIRKGDILLRTSYAIKVNEKFVFTPSLLPIYHLSNDQLRVKDLPKPLSIEGSKGLTLNANLYLDYSLNSKNALQCSFGFPMLTRKVRPDGLTRSLVANLEYSIKF